MSFGGGTSSSARASTARSQYDISGNNVSRRQAQGGAIFVNNGSGTGVFSGQIVDNIDRQSRCRHSARSSRVGIHASARGAGGSHTTLIDGNQVYQILRPRHRAGGGRRQPDAGRHGDQQHRLEFADAINSLHGIHFDFGILSGDNAQITIDVRNNLIANAGNDGAGGVDFRMRVRRKQRRVHRGL